jgi:hypothetical protein
MERELEHPAAPAQAQAPAQARAAAAAAAAAMDLLALQGRGSADEMELDERVDELDEMELDERVNEDGGLDEMQLVRSGDGRATPRARATTAEQKRV